MSNVAIVYWSGTGNTEAMADFVAEGVEAKGGTATIIQAADFGAERVPEFDTFAFGCPAMGDEELEEAGVQPVETVIAKDYPDDEAAEACRHLGELLA